MEFLVSNFKLFDFDLYVKFRKLIKLISKFIAKVKKLTMFLTKIIG